MTEDGGQDIGAGLRLAREASGLSLRQIADATKLSVRTLEDLENNRIKQLPGGIYRRAIVRAYASEIGLDPETTVRAFVARHPDDVPSSAPLVAVEVVPSRRRLLRSVVNAVGALLPILAGAFYFTLNARGGRGALQPPRNAARSR